MKKCLFLHICIALLATISCSYSLFINAYPHLKTIHISPFENMTSEFALAQDFQSHLVNKFQSDGRLKIATLSPDSRIEGSVLDYRNEILSYDIAGNVSEYRVTILFNLTMTDLVYSQVLYENASLMVSETYSTTTTEEEVNPYDLSRTRQLQATSEAEAIEKIFDKVFDTIIKSTLEAW